jgi:hypothetical protein
MRLPMATQPSGPFDRILRRDERPEEPDRAAIYIIGTILGLGLLLLILILPPISILSGGDGGTDIQTQPGDADTYTATARSNVPKLPAGLVAASAFFELSAPADMRGGSRLTVLLKERLTDDRGLALYTYVDDKWQRLGDATLVAGGDAARGDVSALPGNVAVLRRSQSTLQVAGAIPAGTELHEDAGPALTTLYPIVFIPTDDGGVAGEPPAVPPASYKVVPVIVAPNPEVVNNILRSGELRQAHATALADAVRQGNFAGINVDYRAVNASLGEQFSDFVDQLQAALHADGRTLTLTLPMPAVEAGNVETGAYEWARLGELADSIEMTPELDQELYFQLTEAALEYAVGQMDSRKLMITIPTLSVERGGDGMRTMSLNDALTLASQISVQLEGEILPSAPVQLVAQNLSVADGASGLYWDEAARAVTFSYPGRGGKRTVWIANAFSAAFRLELAERYELGGVVLSDVSQSAGDVWSAVQELADSGSVTLTKPNGEMLVPVWEAVAGSLSQPGGDTVAWTAPAEPGAYDVTLIVSDGIVRAAQRVALEVVEAAAPPPE